MIKHSDLKGTKYVFSNEEVNSLLDILSDVIYSKYDIDADGEICNEGFENSYGDINDSEVLNKHRKLLIQFLSTHRSNHVV